MSLTETDNPTVLRAERVSGNLFETLRARPFIGRTFTGQEGAVGAAPVVVLSHALWQERFGGEVSALDRTMSTVSHTSSWG
jgi:putative ABC transport system permease protein